MTFGVPRLNREKIELQRKLEEYRDDELVQYIALVQKHKNVDDYDHNMYLTALREFFIRGLDYVKPELVT